MKVPLRDIKRVKTHSLLFVIRHWRTSFSIFEKLAIGASVVLLLLSSAGWVYAASRQKVRVPKVGGTFVEGVVGKSVEDVELGRLTKSALVKLNQDNQIAPELASSWEISDDKLSYKFALAAGVSASEIIDALTKNPAYLPHADFSSPDLQTLVLKLEQPNSDLLRNLTKPVFTQGPYLVEKKTKNELRLKINGDYPLEKPYIEKFTVRIYPDQKAIEKAAQKNSISGAVGLEKLPKDWQEKKLTLGKKHILFVNSSKTYLKSTKVREKLLAGEKPEGIQTLDVLEVNGDKLDADYVALKDKLKAAGIELKERRVSLKDALSEDLPKRNYDLLYLLVNEGDRLNPYALWNSANRSGAGQNFAELANADVDQLTEEYQNTTDEAKKVEILARINEEIASEKVAVEYKNIETNYSVNDKVKGFVVAHTCSCEASRFDLVSKWYLREGKL